MTTPTGAPAWSRTASHEIYGGDVDKQNYQTQGLVNGKTDVGAEGLCRMFEDEAAATRTAVFARLNVTCRDSSPAAPLIEAVHQMTGVRLASYAGDAAPAGFPSAARNGNGDVTIDWASAYTDAYGISEPTNIKHAQASALGAAAVAVNPDVLSATSVRVRCRVFPAGTDASNAKFTIEVA